jgi:hypothetical protein
VKILWIGTATECEPDIVHDAKLFGLDLEVWNVDEKLTAEQRYDETTRTRDVPGGRALVQLVQRATFDLAVFRFPYYFDREVDLTPLRDRPVVAWSSEQGPMLDEAMRVCEGFANIAVNNRHEMPAWRARFPDRWLHYLPFGCTERRLSVIPEPKERDFIADGKCHYACTRCGHDWKRRSVETMILPLIEDWASLALYGPNEDLHGWYAVPGAGEFTRGEYAPEKAALVYARHKVYVGISWNWGLGGYGAKLARALAARIPVLWHRTVGMAEDGLISGVHLVTSSSAEETRLRARELLQDDDRRRELAGMGQAFALDRWRWAPNLLRLLDEVRHPSG